MPPPPWMPFRQFFLFDPSLNSTACGLETQLKRNAWLEYIVETRPQVSSCVSASLILYQAVFPLYIRPALLPRSCFFKHTDSFSIFASHLMPGRTLAVPHYQASSTITWPDHCEQLIPPRCGDALLIISISAPSTRSTQTWLLLPRLSKFWFSRKTEAPRMPKSSKPSKRTFPLVPPTSMLQWMS